MSNGYSFIPEAVDDMRRLSPADQKTVLHAIAVCRDKPWAGKPLNRRSLQGMFRRRVELPGHCGGRSYRVVFDRPKPDSVRILAVDDRSVVYEAAEARAFNLVGRETLCAEVADLRSRVDLAAELIERLFKGWLHHRIRERLAEIEHLEGDYISGAIDADEYRRRILALLAGGDLDIPDMIADDAKWNRYLADIAAMEAVV